MKRYWAVPPALGLWSLLLGADTNWDLYNYHLYNPFALLHGKLAVDLAPAGLQSYFNPLPDVPYYLAVTHLPSRLVGFLMGALHGLNFLLLALIARRVLPAEAKRAPFWLALAGVLTGNFLSELGNTMGDNATALFVLGGMLAALASIHRIESARPAVVSILVAGLLAGMGAGLKLTNAMYAFVMCVGLLTLPLTAAQRVRLAAGFAIGTVAGMALTGGYWWMVMARTFGNPLFPQFGTVFPNDLAAPVGVADTAWTPKTVWQVLTWPFQISWDAKRAGQLGLRQVIWLLLYVAFIGLAISVGWRRGRARSMSPLPTAARYVLIVVGAGFIVWMLAFGIYRYLVPIELLAPLALALIALARWPLPKAMRVARGMVGAATFVALTGMKTWGHGGWSDPLVTVDVPALADPAKTTVLIAGGDPPWAWLAMAFPREVAFVQVGGNFPEGPRFRPALEERIAARGGELFALVTGHHDARLDSGKPARRDIDAENRAERDKAVTLLARYGFVLDPEACRLRGAAMGTQRRLFQWCPLTRGVRPAQRTSEASRGSLLFSQATWAMRQSGHLSSAPSRRSSSSPGHGSPAALPARHARRTIPLPFGLQA